MPEPAPPSACAVLVPIGGAIDPGCDDALRLLERRDEPWFPITDPGQKSAIQVTELYGRRMGIEEFFRDTKSVRNGLALRHTQLARADRFDRFILTLVLAYLLLTGLGLRAMAECRPGEWSSRNKGTPCSAAMVGRTMRRRFRLSPTAAILTATITAGANWG